MTGALPLPGTPEAIGMGCKCTQRHWSWTVFIHPDCPLHSESARAARDEDRAQPVRLSGSAT